MSEAAIHAMTVVVIVLLVALNALTSAVALRHFRRSGLWVYAVGTCVPWAVVGYIIAVLMR